MDDAAPLTPAGQTDRERLSVEYPGWKIWSTDGGVLMASRRRALTDAEVAAGLARTLPYGDDDLAGQLAEQARIERALSGAGS